MKLGEKTRDLKFLQVDLKFKNVLSGKRESMCSRSSGGSLLQIPGSISVEPDVGDFKLLAIMGDFKLPDDVVCWTLS